MQISGTQITTAEKPLSPIEKGLAAPGLLAYLIVSKYGDHLPLYRLERILERYGVEIARSIPARRDATGWPSVPSCSGRWMSDQCTTPACPR